MLTFDSFWAAITSVIRQLIDALIVAIWGTPPVA